MGLQSLIQRLLPKEDKFFAILEKQGALSFKAAQTLAMFSNSGRTNEQTASDIQDIEHEGDALVTSLEEELAKTFVTPIDREDIYKLSIEIDDVIDYCNQAARASVLFNVQTPTAAMDQLMYNLLKCTQHLSAVLPALRKHNFSEFYRVKGAVKELEKCSDKIYRSEVSKLFNIDSDRIHPSFFAQKEVLDKLENAVDRCEDITLLLVNLAVKHG